MPGDVPRMGDHARGRRDAAQQVIGIDQTEFRRDRCPILVLQPIRATPALAWVDALSDIPAALAAR